jgi:hypothetical protein
MDCLRSAHANTLEQQPGIMACCTRRTPSTRAVTCDFRNVRIDPGPLPAASNLRIKSPRPCPDGDAAPCSALPVRAGWSAFAVPPLADQPRPYRVLPDRAATSEQTTSKQRRAWTARPLARLPRQADTQAGSLNRLRAAHASDVDREMTEALYAAYEDVEQMDHAILRRRNG